MNKKKLLMAITDGSCDYHYDCSYKKFGIGKFLVSVSTVVMTKVMAIIVVLTVMVVSEFLSDCHHFRHHSE